MRSAKLPTKLTHRIIDFLWDELVTLCACALVCHAWLPRARYHIFGKIVIRDRHSFQSVVRATHTPHLQPFFAYTRALVLCDGDHEGSGPEWWMHRLPFLLVLNPQLSRVTSLGVDGMSWTFGDYEDYPLMVKAPDGSPILPLIVHLSLTSATFCSFELLQLVLCSFPRLRTVALHRINLVPRLEDDVSVLPVSHLCLTSLTTSWVPAVLYTWLCNTPCVHSLSHLSLHVHTGFERETMTLIWTVAGGLKELRLTFETQQQFKAFSAGRTLSDSYSLQVLVLTLSSFEDAGINVSAVLSQLPYSCSLLHFGLNYNLQITTAVAHSRELKRISDNLMQERFRGLQIFEADIGVPLYTYTDAYVDKEVRSVLAGLTERGAQIRVHAHASDFQ